MYQTILSRPWQAPNDVTHILSTGSSHLILLFLIWLNYFVFNHLLISHYFIPSLCLFSVMSPFIYSPLILNPHQLIQSPLHRGISHRHFSQSCSVVHVITTSSEGNGVEQQRRFHGWFWWGFKNETLKNSTFVYMRKGSRRSHDEVSSR